MIHFENSYARLPSCFYARVAPAQVPAPALIQLNRRLCRELALDPDWLASPEGSSMLAGTTLPDSADAIAMVYAGHQFGGFSPQLGDGRAILLGEVKDRNKILRDIQLKGAGRTPFSRGGDGKATLSAVLREYILSEAMFALGVPTTRALAVVTTGESVDRGEVEIPGAILTRVAHSHVRVGTFQHFSAQRDTESLKALTEYVIARHYPQARESSNPAAALLEHTVAAQAELVARWMQLGFIHGVMNTDNMQVVGETLDYGPCAFMDDFHPKCVFSSVDRDGRYAWDQQPGVAKWNLTRLAEAMLPLLSPDLDTALAIASTVPDRFEKQFESAFAEGFRRKLGLLNRAEGDAGLLAKTSKCMADNRVDFTLFFRRLTQVADGDDQAPLIALFATPRKGLDWLATWRARAERETESQRIRVAVMQGVNPIFIPRNHRVEEAIEAGLGGDFEPFYRLVELLSRPYKEQTGKGDYEAPPLEHQKVRETFCNT